MRIWHQSFTDLDMVPLYRRALVEHAAAVSDPGVSVTVHGLKPSTYGPDVAPIDAIRHPYLEMLNERQLIEAALTAEREGYDAMALACFYDPGIRAARSLVDMPIAGLSETAMLTTCSLGQRFALIALNKDQQAQHEESAHAYGLEKRFAASLAMEPPIDEYICLKAATRPPGPSLKASTAPAAGRLRRALGLQVSRMRYYAKPSAAMLTHARSFAGVEPIAEGEFSGRGDPEQP